MMDTRSAASTTNATKKELSPLAAQAGMAIFIQKWLDTTRNHITKK
jgi:hypothetical protein